jgi:hypothetical protein
VAQNQINGPKRLVAEPLEGAIGMTETAFEMTFPGDGRIAGNSADVVLGQMQWTGNRLSARLRAMMQKGDPAATESGQKDGQRAKFAGILGGDGQDVERRDRHQCKISLKQRIMAELR